MKSNTFPAPKILVVLIIILPVLLLSQQSGDLNYWSGDCMLFYDHAKARDLYKFSELPNQIKKKLDSIVHIQYRSFAKHMSFKAARIYNRWEFKGPLEELERKMYVDVLYSIKMRGKRVKNEDLDEGEEIDSDELEEEKHERNIDLDGLIVREYCINFTMDSLGHRIQPVHMPDQKWLSKGIISPKQVKKIAIAHCKIKGFISTKKAKKAKFKRVVYGDIRYLELCFHAVERCFIWVTRVKGQEIVINAHSGDILYSYEAPRRKGVC